jgi:hypothetical protein
MKQTKEISEQKAVVKQDDPIVQYLENHDDDPFAPHGINLYFSTETMDEMLVDQNEIITKFMTDSHYTLTPSQRKALIGTGIKNFGFLEKAFQLAQEFGALHPIRFSMEEFENGVQYINFCRNMQTRIREFDRVITDSMLVYGDRTFRLALQFYRSARDLARQGDQDAMAVFNMLRPYFSRSRSADAPPTEPEIISHAKALLHGKKEGRIVIEGRTAHKTAAAHAVIDEVHPHTEGAFRETVSGTAHSTGSVQVCRYCNTENPAHHKFCLHCGKEL